LPVLANAKHESVVQAFIADPAKVGWRAYKAAYPQSSQRAAETAFGRLMKDKAFAARINDLLSEAAQGAVATARQVLEELTKIALANMLDYMKVGPKGDPVLDLSTLTRDRGAVVHEVTVDTYVEGRGDEAREVKRVRFKLCDKLGALRDLGRHHKLFTDKTEHEVGATLEQLVIAAARSKGHPV
jgi:phage terminase small subunit